MTPGTGSRRDRVKKQGILWLAGAWHVDRHRRCG